MAVSVEPLKSKDSEADSESNDKSENNSKLLPGEFLIKDSKGRSIILKRPSPRTDIYFPTLFTAAESTSPSFMTEVRLFTYVKSIDGMDTGSLDKKTDLDFLIDRMGYEGRKALQLGYTKYFAREDIKEQEEINEEIKKLL